MHISNISSNTNLSQLAKVDTVEISAFSINSTVSSDSILNYYQQLCSQYPDITFRLDDIETSSQQSNVYLGYKNSMNQIGENFGSVGQCSISIDVTVIKHMMNDPQYENQVKDEINYTVNHYSLYEEETKLCGMQYTSVCLQDENGKFEPAIVRSHVPYSTEEEVREMWNHLESNTKKEILNRHETQSIDLFDQFMEMLDHSHEKHKELIQQYYIKDSHTDK